MFSPSSLNLVCLPCDLEFGRLFNEEDGRAFLVENSVAEFLVSNLDLLGFSGISNVLTAIKMAKYYEMGEHSSRDAAADFARWVLKQSTDNMLELRHPDRRRVHNLKYYNWVEQQGKTYEEIQDMWNQSDYWTGVQKQADEIDALINEFNSEVGLK